MSKKEERENRIGNIKTEMNSSGQEEYANEDQQHKSATVSTTPHTIKEQWKSEEDDKPNQSKRGTQEKRSEKPEQSSDNEQGKITTDNKVNSFDFSPSSDGISAFVDRSQQASMISQDATGKGLQAGQSGNITALGFAGDHRFPPIRPPSTQSSPAGPRVAEPDFQSTFLARAGASFAAASANEDRMLAGGYDPLEALKQLLESKVPATPVTVSGTNYRAELPLVRNPIPVIEREVRSIDPIQTGREAAKQQKGTKQAKIGTAKHNWRLAGGPDANTGLVTGGGSAVTKDATRADSLAWGDESLEDAQKRSGLSSVPGMSSSTSPVIASMTSSFAVAAAHDDKVLASGVDPLEVLKQLLHGGTVRNMVAVPQMGQDAPLLEAGGQWKEKERLSGPSTAPASSMNGIRDSTRSPRPESVQHGCTGQLVQHPQVPLSPAIAAAAGSGQDTKLADNGDDDPMDWKSTNQSATAAHGMEGTHEGAEKIESKTSAGSAQQVIDTEIPMKEAWESTPHDYRVSWLGVVLDNRAVPAEGTREAWIMRTCDEIAKDFVTKQKITQDRDRSRNRSVETERWTHTAARKDGHGCSPSGEEPAPGLRTASRLSEDIPGENGHLQRGPDTLVRADLPVGPSTSADVKPHAVTGNQHRFDEVVCDRSPAGIPGKGNASEVTCDPSLPQEEFRPVADSAEPSCRIITLDPADEVRASAPASTPPLAQAEGKGTTDSGAGRKSAAEQGRRRGSGHRSALARRLTQGEGANQRTEPSQQPPVSPQPSILEVLKGNPFAVLADAAEEIAESRPIREADSERKGRATSRKCDPQRREQRKTITRRASGTEHPRDSRRLDPRVPHTLADHVPPEIVNRRGEKEKQKTLRRQRQLAARQDRVTMLDTGMEGIVSEHMFFRSRSTARMGVHFVVTARDRQRFAGLDGTVSEHVKWRGNPAVRQVEGSVGSKTLTSGSEGASREPKPGTAGVGSGPTVMNPQGGVTAPAVSLLRRPAGLKRGERPPRLSTSEVPADSGHLNSGEWDKLQSIIDGIFAAASREEQAETLEQNARKWNTYQLGDATGPGAPREPDQPPVVSARDSHECKMMLVQDSLKGLDGFLSDRIQSWSQVYWRVDTLAAPDRASAYEGMDGCVSDRIRYKSRNTSSAPNSLHYGSNTRAAAVLPEERLCVTVQFGKRWLQVSVYKRTWRRVSRHCGGEAAIRWLLTAGLEDEVAVQTPEVLIPRHTLRFRDGTAIFLGRHQVPRSWGSLKRFINSGGIVETIPILCGGMPYPTTGPWDELDFAVQELQAGRRHTNPAANSVAETLLANYEPGRWSALPQLTGLRGQVTLARLLALREVAQEHADSLRKPAIAAWVLEADWVDIRICDVRYNELQGGGNMDEAKASIARKISGIAGLDGGSMERDTVQQSVRMEGDERDTEGYWTINVLIPRGTWITELLQGSLRVTPSSYCTLAPSGTFTEVLMDEGIGTALKSLSQALQLEAGVFRGLLNRALREAFETDTIFCRITTASFSTAKEGKGKRRVEHFRPDSEESRIAFGIDAISLLAKFRISPEVALQLGVEGQITTVMQIPCPTCPRAPLYAMIAAGTPLRYRPTGMATTTTTLLLGTAESDADFATSCGFFAGGWLSDKLSNSRGKKAAATNAIRLGFRTHVSTIWTQFIGQSQKKGGGGDPLLLYVAFSSKEATQAFCMAVDAQTLPAPLMAAMSSLFLRGTLVTYCCSVPPEAFGVLKEKDLLNKLRTATSPENTLSTPYAPAARG